MILLLVYRHGSPGLLSGSLSGSLSGLLSGPLPGLSMESDTFEITTG